MNDQRDDPARGGTPQWPSGDGAAGWPSSGDDPDLGARRPPANRPASGEQPPTQRVPGGEPRGATPRRGGPGGPGGAGGPAGPPGPAGPGSPPPGGRPGGPGGPGAPGGRTNTPPGGTPATRRVPPAAPPAASTVRNSPAARPPGRGAGPGRGGRPAGSTPQPGEGPTDLMPPVSEPEFSPEPELLTHRDDDYALASLGMGPAQPPPDEPYEYVRDEGPDDDDLRAARKKKIWRRVRRSLYVAAALGVLAPIATFFVMYQFVSVPNPNVVAAGQNKPVTIYYADGSVLQTVNDNARTLIGIDQVPANVAHAVEAAEDKNFETDSGFDISAILRSVRNNLTGGVGGGSTITQEYIKVATGNDQHTITRKLNEVVEAFKMTNTYTKPEILAAYLNTVYFGRGAYGIVAAAKAYFNETPQQLTPSQAALIAGMIQKPGYGNVPAVEQQRWQYVMGQLHDNHWVDDAYYEANHKVAQFPQTAEYNSSGGSNASLPWDRQLIVNEVFNELSQQGYTQDALERTGAKIYTSIDPAAQGDAETAISTVLAPDGALTDGQAKTISIHGSGSVKVSATQAMALVSINPSTGGIIAWYGGNDPKQADYDLAMTAQQPGSSFKPYVFAAGLQQNPSQIGLDAIYPGMSGISICGQTVHNASGDANQPNGYTVQDGMTKSINTVFYTMGCDMGVKYVAQLAHAVGIPTTYTNPISGATSQTLQNPGGGIDAGISIGQYAVRPVDQAQGYATLANGGMYIPAHFVEKMTDNSGNIIYQFNKPATQVLGSNGQAIAATVAKAMEGVAAFDQLAIANRGPIAAKTGTVQWQTTVHDSEAWMVGFTPQVATAVWFGNRDTPGPISGHYGHSYYYDVYGANEPAQAFSQYMLAYLNGKPVQQLFPGVQTIGGNYNFVTNQPGASLNGDSTGSTTQNSAPATSQTPTTTQDNGGGNGGGGGLPTFTFTMPTTTKDRDTTTSTCLFGAECTGNGGGGGNGGNGGNGGG